MDKSKIISELIVEMYNEKKQNEELGYYDGVYRYKGYTIEPKVVCFDIRYFVYGDGFIYSHYEDIVAAKEAIDEYIATKYVNKLLEHMSAEAGVSKDTMKKVLRKTFEVK